MRSIRFLLFLVLISALNLSKAQTAGSVSLRDTIRILGNLCFKLKDQDAELARQYGRRSVTLASQSADSCLLARSYLNWGNANNSIYPDSAYIAYQQGLKLSYHCRNSGLRADLFHNIGELLSTAGNRYEAAISYDSAMRLARLSGDSALLCMTTINYALFRLENGDTATAIKEFREVTTFPPKGENAVNIALAISGLINCGDIPPDQVIMFYDSAIQLLKSVPGHEESISQLLINKSVRLPAPEALLLLRNAIEISPVYYPTNILAAWNLIAYAYSDMGDNKSALIILADSAIPLGKKTKNYDWLSTIYDTYAEILALDRQYEKAYQMQRKAMSYYIADNLRKNTTQLTLLMSMTDARIMSEKLNQQEILIGFQKARASRMQLWWSIALLGVGIVFLLWLLFLNKQKVKAQRLQMEAASRLVTLGDRFNESLANELHDTSTLLALAISGNNSNEIEPIRKNISRLSHQLLIKSEQIGFEDQLRSLADTYITFFAARVNLHLHSGLPVIGNEQQVHLLRMVSEMFQNSVRHAPSATISLQSYLKGKTLIILFQDDGPGFDPKAVGAGLGLESLRQRAVLIGATLDMQTEPGRGVTWRVTVRL